MNQFLNDKIRLLHNLIAGWEQETVEFKGSGPGGHDISEYVSALANEAFLNHKQFTALFDDLVLFPELF